MSIVCARAVRGFVLVTGSSVGLAACSTAQTPDPCALLSASDALPYVGPLTSPPYRTSDGAADVRGDQCMYRGKDGRQITVAPDFSGGGTTAGSSVQNAAGIVGGALNKASGSGAGDTMAHRVVKAEIAGPWDKATWIPGGSLFASKGTRSVQIDVSGASGKEADALALAKIIVPRFDHPLSYDGAKAVALAPKPHAHPANACDFIPRADVEAAIGPLAGAPKSDSPETSCTYRVATAKGERDYVVEFVWQGGQKNYTMLKHQMATVGEAMGGGMPSSFSSGHHDASAADAGDHGRFDEDGRRIRGQGQGARCRVDGRIPDRHHARRSLGQRVAAPRHAAHRRASRRVRRDGTPIGGLRKGEGAAGGNLFAALI